MHLYKYVFVYYHLAAHLLFYNVNECLLAVVDFMKLAVLNLNTLNTR